MGYSLSLVKVRSLLSLYSLKTEHLISSMFLAGLLIGLPIFFGLWLTWVRIRKKNLNVKRLHCKDVYSSYRNKDYHLGF